MKLKSTLTTIAAFLTFALVSSSALADAAWPNYSRVMERAQALADSVEILDESLHAINATEEVIEVIHHFEETVLAAVEEFSVLSYEEALVELDHLREDIFLVYDSLDQAGFFNSGDAINAWNKVLGRYIALERSMDRP